MGDVAPRIEQALQSALAPLIASDCPPRLGQALRHAVFPGGARIRPRLVFAVADACGGGCDTTIERAAAAVEFLHCASLAQDDLGCFDDAAIRRGRPALHVAFDERLAILASDALIVAAFALVAEAPAAAAETRLQLISQLSLRLGSRGGITAGQAWECEPEADLDAYHRAKTGALFAAAAEVGALAAGHTAGHVRDWAAVGEHIGAAYQVADDLRDVLGKAEHLGKPTAVDAVLGRPNAVHRLGMRGASERLVQMIEQVVESIPPCLHRDRLIETVRHEAVRFLPAEMARSAA